VRFTLVVLLLAACGDEYNYFDASIPLDAGVEDQGVLGEGGIPVSAAFTIQGCDKLTFDTDAHPLCSAPRGRPLTFIPLGVGASSVMWKFPSGEPASSNLLTPDATWSTLGSFTVSLAAGGSGGTALGSGTVQIVPGQAGAGCLADEDCDATVGLTCLCPGGVGCPASLEAGLCVRRCESAVCVPGEACIDLARGGAALPDGGTTDGGASDPFRARVCLPTCVDDTSCRIGFACRAMPEVASGAPLGASYTWVDACFAPVLGDVGAACDDPDGTPNGSRCLTGRCESLGARGICTDDCADVACPASAVCVTLPTVGARCLRRCTSGGDCGDPLMACDAPGPGGLGFALPPSEPSTTTLCAPKRCTSTPDCAPAGTCQTVSGAQFCR
jgi:hypothetical protein